MDGKGDAAQPAGGRHLRSGRLGRAIANASQSWEHAVMWVPVASTRWHSGISSEQYYWSGTIRADYV